MKVLQRSHFVEVEIYADFDIEKEYNDLESYEKPIADELKLLKNVTLKECITIEEILDKINENCVPILGFYRDGIKSNGHFSPLRGLISGKLILPLGDEGGSCDCDIDEFINVWWMDKTCILVKKI